MKGERARGREKDVPGNMKRKWNKGKYGGKRLWEQTFCGDKETLKRQRARGRKSQKNKQLKMSENKRERKRRWGLGGAATVTLII
jgi:hypothetical protein